MRFSIAVLAANLLLASAPNPKLTPGAVDPACNAAKSCGSEYAKSVRNVPLSEKRKVCAAYGITKGCPGPAWELDHLISLTVCGLNVKENLWPQPIAEAHEKDKAEMQAHLAVCHCVKAGGKDCDEILRSWQETLRNWNLEKKAGK